MYESTSSLTHKFWSNFHQKQISDEDWIITNKMYLLCCEVSLSILIHIFLHSLSQSLLHSQVNKSITKSVNQTISINHVRSIYQQSTTHTTDYAQSSIMPNEFAKPITEKTSIMNNWFSEILKWVNIIKNTSIIKQHTKDIPFNNQEWEVSKTCRSFTRSSKTWHTFGIINVEFKVGNIDKPWVLVNVHHIRIQLGQVQQVFHKPN